MRPDIERRQAICELLLSLPDAPDLRRGHRRTLEGTPARYRLVPQLTAAFIQAKLLELRERHVAWDAAHGDYMPRAQSVKLERWMLRSALGLAILAVVDILSFCISLTFEKREPR